MSIDFSGILPNELVFQTWEEEEAYRYELHVDNQHPSASDQEEKGR